MSKKRQFLWVIGAAALLILGLNTSSFAVLSYNDANSFRSETREYQLGYASGTVDMLRALVDAGKLAPPNFNAQATAITNCLGLKKNSEVIDMYNNYIKQNPERADRNSASAMYNAIRIACNIN